MKVAGFTFIRNAVKYGYPIKEAILSILDLCDKVFVAVGDSEDDTLHLVKNINPSKIEIIPTIWDDSLKKGGAVLAKETNKAFAAIPNEYDWCIYIQGDEMMHEDDFPVIRKAMVDNLNDKRIDGLLFKYFHFYGSYDYIATSSDWYRHEIRIIKNDKSIYSYRDAQGFRKISNKKLNVKALDATIYHYGWVRPPEIMLEKIRSFKKLYSNNETTPEIQGSFDYSQIDKLDLFKGQHPHVIQELIKNKNWRFEKDISFNNLSLIERFRLFVERLTGIMPWEYRNYKLIK